MRLSFEDGKKTLIEFYSEMQSALGTRLIGFVVGLFALLQLVQFSKSARLGEIFPIFKNWQDFGSQWKFIFLFIGVLILMVYIVRTIFRYAVYGRFMIKVLEQNIVQIGSNESATNKIHTLVMSKMSNQKLYWIFPSSWFLAGSRRSNICGWFVSLIISLVLTGFLLWLIS
jgi:hypothetical protein